MTLVGEETAPQAPDIHILATFLESPPETLSGRKWGKSQKCPTSRNKGLAESQNRISPLILVSWAFRRGLKKGGAKEGPPHLTLRQLACPALLTRRGG